MNLDTAVAVFPLALEMRKTYIFAVKAIIGSAWFLQKYP